MSRNRTSYDHFCDIEQFWKRVNRLLRETRQQPELFQPLICGEWFTEVHEDNLLYSFVLPPHLQALTREMYELNISTRKVPWTERGGSQFVWECHKRIAVIQVLFDFLLDQEVANLTILSPTVKGKPTHKYLCEDWTMKFIEKYN